MSAVTGLSWPLESLTLRDLYIGYAITARENDRAANPECRFSPRKPTVHISVIVIEDTEIADDQGSRDSVYRDEEDEEDMDIIQGLDTIGARVWNFGGSGDGNRDRGSFIYSEAGGWNVMESSQSEMDGLDLIQHNYCSLMKLYEQRELHGYDGLDDESYHGGGNFDFEEILTKVPEGG